MASRSNGARGSPRETGRHSECSARVTTVDSTGVAGGTSAATQTGAEPGDLVASNAVLDDSRLVAATRPEIKRAKRPAALMLGASAVPASRMILKRTRVGRHR